MSTEYIDPVVSMTDLEHEADRSSSQAIAPSAQLRVAVLIPCFNEELTVGDVVSDFRAHLPSADIYVYDNNSVDRTIEVAQASGARIGYEERQGKGNVVRRMFADVDADVYVLVDGDGTYDAASAPRLIQTLLERSHDMVAASRALGETTTHRPGHQFGNYFLTRMVGFIFRSSLVDILTGYRVFSRRFVKSFPALSRGFEVETELTVHALELRLSIAEVAVQYRNRPEGSTSKLHTFRDGLRIVRLIGFLVVEERPLLFFLSFSGILASISLFLAWPIVGEYMETGLVPRLPTALLATGVMLLAFLSLVCGLVLHVVTLGRTELKRMWYLTASGSLAGQKR